MSYVEITDPLFVEAVAAIDHGNEQGLAVLLKNHPHLLRERLPSPKDGYFREPYLLWFVAENPVRNGKLPKNIGSVTRLIIDHAKQSGVPSLQEQVNDTLSLVCSGRVPREHRVQSELIDILVEYGGNPDNAMKAALHHREVEAMERLIHHNARMTLPIAIALGKKEKMQSLINASSTEEIRTALTAAAHYGDADALRLLLTRKPDVNALNPEGFHSHSTPLHQAVWSGSLDCVRALIAAGADIRIKDSEYNASSLSWAIHCNQPAIETHLRQTLAHDIVMRFVSQGIINESDASNAIDQIASELVV